MKVRMHALKSRLQGSWGVVVGLFGVFVLGPSKTGAERVVWTALGVFLTVGFGCLVLLFPWLNSVWVGEREFRSRHGGHLVVVPYSDLEDIQRLEWGTTYGLITRPKGERMVFTFTNGRKPFTFNLWLYSQRDRDRLYGLVVAAAKGAGWVPPRLRSPLDHEPGVDLEP